MSGRLNAVPDREVLVATATPDEGSHDKDLVVAGRTTHRR